MLNEKGPNLAPFFLVRPGHVGAAKLPDGLALSMIGHREGDRHWRCVRGQDEDQLRSD